MFKGHSFPKSIILQAVYFKFRFGLSYRDIEELMAIRGVKVDYATIENNGKPELINIDKSGANEHTIRVNNKRSLSKIKIRQCRYLNNIIEQDHRSVKKRITAGLVFKEFEFPKRTMSEIEMAHMIKKEQLICNRKSMFKSFYSLAV